MQLKVVGEKMVGHRSRLNEREVLEYAPDPVFWIEIEGNS